MAPAGERGRSPYQEDRARCSQIGRRRTIFLSGRERTCARVSRVPWLRSRSHVDPGREHAYASVSTAPSLRDPDTRRKNPPVQQAGGVRIFPHRLSRRAYEETAGPAEEARRQHCRAAASRPRVAGAAGKSVSRAGPGHTSLRENSRLSPGSLHGRRMLRHRRDAGARHLLTQRPRRLGG
jgi:hypothetical protein